MYFTIEPNIQICGLLYGGYVAYPCLRWLWHWWRLNWRHWPLTRWCSRHRSHWRSDVTPAGTPWRAPPCCMPCELALSTLRPESHCTPLWEGWRKKTNHQQKKKLQRNKIFVLFEKAQEHLPSLAGNGDIQSIFVHIRCRHHGVVHLYDLYFLNALWKQRQEGQTVIRTIISNVYILMDVALMNNNSPNTSMPAQ